MIKAALTGGTGATSALATQGVKLSTPPPATSIIAPGIVTIDGPYGTWDYLPTTADISAILASLATLSSAQQQLETLLDATTASEFFMTPPLEIYIDMEEESEFEEELEEDF